MNRRAALAATALSTDGKKCAGMGTNADDICRTNSKALAATEGIGTLSQQIAVSPGGRRTDAWTLGLRLSARPLIVSLYGNLRLQARVDVGILPGAAFDQ